MQAESGRWTSGMVPEPCSHLENLNDGFVSPSAEPPHEQGSPHLCALGGSLCQLSYCKVSVHLKYTLRAHVGFES